MVTLLIIVGLVVVGLVVAQIWVASDRNYTQKAENYFEDKKGMVLQ